MNTKVIFKRLPLFLGGLLIFLALVFLCEGGFSVLSCVVFSVDVMLAMLPYPGEEGYKVYVRYVLALSAALSLLVPAAGIFHILSADALAMAVAAVSLLFLMVFMFRGGYFTRRQSSQEYCVRTVAVLFFLLVMVAFMEAGGRRHFGVPAVMMLLFMAGSAVFMFFRTRTPARAKPVPVREEGLPDYGLMDERARMETLFDRVDALMKEKKLFLDEDLTLGDVASQLSCNKVYVSRAILDKTGYNFRQYINRFRIEYGLEILKKDPDMKVSELSALCGFHSQPTFNLAFRMILRKTPSEWKREFRGVRD